MYGLSRKRLWTITGASFLFTYPLWQCLPYPGYKTKKNYPERTVVVTGATSTLGGPLVRVLAERQCRVIMACRDMDECKSLRREIVLMTKNHSIACRHVDLEDIDSIDRFAENLIETEPHIDILINNAAIKDCKEKELTKYGIEKNFFVNFLAPYFLTLKLLEKMKESAAVSKDSRVINIIGNINKKWSLDLEDINFEKRKYDSRKSYQQSKVALAYFTIQLERICRQKKNNIYTFGINPKIDRMLSSFYHETDLMNNIIRTFKDTFSISSLRIAHRVLKCALEPTLIKEDSGKLFSHFNISWGSKNGWDHLWDRENDAKIVWNTAAEILMKVQTEKDKKSPTADVDVKR